MSQTNQNEGVALINEFKDELDRMSPYELRILRFALTLIGLGYSRARVLRTAKDLTKWGPPLVSR